MFLLWNIFLTLVVAPILFSIRQNTAEIKRLETELQVIRVLRRNMILQKSKSKIDAEATKTTEKLAQTNKDFSDVLEDVQSENAKVVALISARTDKERES